MGEWWRKGPGAFGLGKSREILHRTYQVVPRFCRGMDSTRPCPFGLESLVWISRVLGKRMWEP